MAIGDVGSATRAEAVTKSDTTIVGCRALYVGGAGDLVVIMLNDYDPANPTSNTTTFEDVPAGSLLPIAVAKVMAATAATLIVALF